ncbi:MAG: sulfatase-like hydrolase/transferase [Planctomycetaceae bacterium]
MSAASDGASGDLSPFFSLRTLHLFSLWNFAVTVPLFSALMRQRVYLHDQQFGLRELISLGILLTAMFPIACWVADRLVILISLWLQGRGRNMVLMVLFGLLGLSLLRPYASAAWLNRWGHSAEIVLPLAACGAWGAGKLYQRAEWFRSWLTAASFGVAAIPVWLIWQFAQFHHTETALPERIAVENPVPIVMVVFDEFSGTTLMNDRRELDAAHWPQFARLAKSSTWYRHATSVHPRTDVAVPAILSGRFPVVERSPLGEFYPGNLLQTLEATQVYDLAVFEPVTRLCPRSVRKFAQRTRTHWEKLRGLVATLATVYPQLVLPRDTPFDLPMIPLSWYGVPDYSLRLPDDEQDLTEGLFNYPGNEQRNRQLDHFLDCLRTSERPRFHFLHVVLPHYSWSYHPTGERYQQETAAPAFPAGTSGELGEDWLDDPISVLRNEYRYRLQVGFVDRFIGRLLDRLESTGLMEECLLIVTGDHGVSFRPGHSRRLPDRENLADLMSVPMFIHFPGQTSGQIDDRNVESVDVYPTIAEILGIELASEIDGISVRQDQRRLRKTFHFQGQSTVVEPEFPQMAESAARQWSLFGERPLDLPPPGISTHPEWHGRPIDSFMIDPRPIAAEGLDWQIPCDAADAEPWTPGFVTGKLNPSDLPEHPSDLLIAIDGVIRDSSRSFRNAGNLYGFEFLLPRSLADRADDHYEIYAIDQSQQTPRLRPIALPTKRSASPAID